MARLLLKNIQLVTLTDVKKEYGILINDAVIEKVFPLSAGLPKADNVLDGQGALATAGLIDLHIHGFGGYGPELGTPEALLKMSDALARHGVTAFCPTLYCAKPEKMKELLSRLSPVIGHEKGARILGFHLEGPFISPLKPGAMKPQDIATPDVTVLEELYQAAQGKITIMTLAPELKDIGPVIDFCLRHHIIPQAGHTNATYEEFCRGAQQGVTHATHAFNAMRAFNHREPGAAGAVLTNEKISCEIIADGVHVHPQLIAFLRRVKKPEQLVLITDALTPTAQEKGPFIANGDRVIFEGGAWRRETDRVITGSALTLPKGISNLVSWGYSLPQAVQCATYNPAQLLQLKNRGQLAPGFQADITLLNPDYSPKAVMICGQCIF